MKVVIVGGGKLGEILATILRKEKHDVILIEVDEKLAEDLADRLDVIVLCGDGSDANILKDANIESADALIAVTGDDKVNLMACEVAKDAKVKHIISRINTTNLERDFEKIGVFTINPNEVSALSFKKLLEMEGKHLISFIAGGKGEIFEMVVRNGSKIVGKSVKEIAKNFSIASIYRENKIIIPKDETRIKEGDILIICAPLEEVKKIEEMFKVDGNKKS